MSELYDELGKNYRRSRQPDRRIQQSILTALGDAGSVLNVGAGTGSYEPTEARVFAIEPSMTMIRQRAPGAAPAIRATATALPLRDHCVDSCLAILTMHHWPDLEAGLAEMRRVARRRIVILSWDPAAPGFWLDEYFPEILGVDRQIFPTMERVASALGDVDVETVSIAHDCSDGFLGSYWKRPEAYLEKRIRNSISTFSKIQDVEQGLARLSADLASGNWERNYGSNLPSESLDLGYRLLISKHNSP